MPVQCTVQLSGSKHTPVHVHAFTGNTHLLTGHVLKYIVHVYSVKDVNDRVCINTSICGHGRRQSS